MSDLPPCERDDAPYNVQIHTYRGREFSALEEAEIAAVRAFVRRHPECPRDELEAAINSLGLSVTSRHDVKFQIY